MGQNEPEITPQGSPLDPYINFVRRLSERLDSELAEEIVIATQCDLIDDPDDPTEIISIGLSIASWRASIGNLKTIADFLAALADMPDPSPSIIGLDLSSKPDMSAEVTYAADGTIEKIELDPKP